MASPLEEGGLKEARDEENNIIISVLTLLSILPPQPKKMSVRYKVMRGYECCIYANRIRSPLLSWRDWYLKKFKDEKNNRLFETYKKYVMTHGNHIYATASDTTMAKICAYPPYQHALTSCKCVLHCCTNFLCIDLPGQDSDRHHSNIYT